MVVNTRAGTAYGQPDYVHAGCGMGDGLRALRQAYPSTRLMGIEWSWMWWAVCALRCPWAQVRRGDMWAATSLGLLGIAVDGVFALDSIPPGTYRVRVHTGGEYEIYTGFHREAQFDVTLAPGAFSDPHLPPDFAPFGIASSSASLSCER